MMILNNCRIKPFDFIYCKENLLICFVPEGLCLFVFRMLIRVVLGTAITKRLFRQFLWNGYCIYEKKQYLCKRVGQ